MKKKIYVCPKCGRGLNFSDNPEYTFQCFECDEDFYAFEAKEVEQPRIEGVVDYTDLAKASMEIQAITDKAIQESEKQIEIKGNDIVEQICEYISETIKPILASGVHNNKTFKDSARIHTNHFCLNFGDYLYEGRCCAQLWGANHMLRVYFNENGEHYIECVDNNVFYYIVREWAELKNSMNSMIAYALNRCNERNKRKIEEQEGLSRLVNSFKL